MSTPDMDYERIEAAVMETARGRWFLKEYAARNRQSDTELLLEAVASLERTVSQQPKGDVARVQFDLMEMAQAIAKTKAEIASIKPDVENQGRIGEATLELDAIVQSTETATSEILAAAEHMQEIAWTLREHQAPDTLCDVLDQRATDIYTACSFQDLTGQRIRKVINVMGYLEARINAMMQIWGGAEVSSVGDLAPDQSSDEVELLNGPALPGQGLGQSDVDLMMAEVEEAVGSLVSSSVSVHAVAVVHSEPEEVLPRHDLATELRDDDLWDADDELAEADEALPDVSPVIRQQAMSKAALVSRMDYVDRIALFS